MAQGLHGNDGLAPRDVVSLELEHVRNDTCSMLWLECLTTVATTPSRLSCHKHFGDEDIIPD